MKDHIPEMYMVGHFFCDIMKLFMCMHGMLIFTQVYEMDNNIYTSNNGVKLVLLQITFVLGLGMQIITNFANMIGMTGDVCYFLYNIDLQIENIYYNSVENYSTPQEIVHIFRKMLTRR